MIKIVSFLSLVLLYGVLSGCNYLTQGQVSQNNKLLTRLDLNQYSGQKVMLHFWAPFCFACKPEMQQLSRLNQQFINNGYQLIGVATQDTPERIKASLDNLSLTYPHVLDADGLIAKDFNVQEIPTTIFLDESGQLLKVYDPERSQLSSRFAGVRSWGSLGMQLSLFDLAK